MPDLTMCLDKECELRAQCYRFRAKPDKFYQSYFAESPREGDTCEYFWKAKLEEENRIGGGK